MLMERGNDGLRGTRLPKILTLIGEFWLSGLFIMSVIFTETDQEQLNSLNLYMFISVGVGSFLGGIFSDSFNRIVVFRVFSVLLAAASVIIVFSPLIGYIMAGAAIGPINSLTFVIIFECFPKKSEKYISYVLMGWAASEITLGLLFMVIQTTTFFYILLGLSLVYLIAVLIFIEREQVQSTNQAQLENSLINNPEQNVENKNSNKCSALFSSIIPTSLKPLIGGCIFMFVMQMFYYRIQFTLDQFGVSLELNTIVVGATQLLANLILTQFLSRTPRRLLVQLLIFFLMGLFMFLIWLQNQILETVVEGFMRVATTSIMITLGVYLPELFFQEERAKGTNYIMAFGVLGSALNGVLLTKLPPWALQFFLLSALLSTLLLHETYQVKESMLSEQD